MCEVARSVHGDVDALSSDDAVASASALLCAFIEKIDPGRDLERGLEVLTSLRQALPNLDAPKAALAERAVALADRARALAGGAETAASRAFARSAFAFVAALLPAIEDPLARLRAATSAGGAALRLACVSHADAFFRAAVGEIPDLAAARAVAAAAGVAGAGAGAGAALDAALCAQVARLVELAIAMPGHPEAGPFYLARGILAALARHAWAPSAAASPLRPLACLSTLSLLHAQRAGAPLPVARIAGVDSNDVLYAGDAAYGDELRAAHGAALAAVVAQLDEAAAGGHKAVLLEAAPELLAPDMLREVLATDAAAAAPLVARAAALLRAVAPQHPALAPAAALVAAAGR